MCPRSRINYKGIRRQRGKEGRGIEERERERSREEERKGDKEILLKNERIKMYLVGRKLSHPSKASTTLLSFFTDK